jgi:lysyl endopeptidase
MFMATFAGPTPAAVPVHIVKSDLRPLIRAGAQSPIQFAVLVPHTMSTTTGGSWSSAAGVATWKYAVQVPTAISLSFHATKSSLPASAVLVVRGTSTTTSYKARDLHRGDLWSRIQPGEALQFELSVPAADRSKVKLNVVSLQAGYRAIGPGIQDHPYYRLLKQQQDQASGNASCVTNYECDVTSGNTAPAAATVGLVIGNQYQCTGAMINDVPRDNSPHLLTARHCETGKLGGGNPGAAADVTVYWDAVTPCGNTLGSIYDPNIPTQTGAQTLVEQQDAWLILLDENPVVSDAQLAGFDASGGAVQGGYTVHHAEGGVKQYTGWFGQADPIQESGVLGVTYLSNFLETVNAVGNIGPGASGSGLFDQNNHLVGSLSLGRTTSDASGYGMCPITNPSAPNGSNGVADFTSLSAVWNSTADATSTTGSATLKSILDPDNTGVLVTTSAPVVSIQLSASAELSSEGSPVALTWSAPTATQCNASGGTSGDGWSGQLAASGTLSVTETTSAYVTYTMNCAYPGGQTASSAVIVDWLGPNPRVQLSAPYAVWTTRPAPLSWASNVSPCTLTGGGLSLEALPASGTTTTTQSSPTDVTYTLTCGPANNLGSTSQTVLYVTPSLVLEQTGSDRILGQTYQLQWRTWADSCVPSGGAPGDGWATTAFFAVGSTGIPFSPNVTTLGTYTYSLTCSSGPLSVQESVTATFEQNPPYVTASISPTTVTYSNSPADYVTLSWNSNMSSCITSVEVAYTDPLDIPYQAQSSGTFAPTGAGSYPISVTCALPGNQPTRVTSTPITLTVLPPPAPTETLSINPATVIEGQAFTVTWSSTNSTYCEGTGGIPGIGWSNPNGTFAFPPSGSFIYTPGGPSQLGNFTFGITCESIDSSVSPTSTQAQLTVQSLTSTLTASASNITVGGSFTLTWSSQGATGCTASGGGANGSPWSGPLATSGTTTETATTSGSFTYTLNCSANGVSAAPQQVVINISAGSSGGSGSSGSGSSSSSGSSHGGGGGSINQIDLIFLAALCALCGLAHSPPLLGAFAGMKRSARVRYSDRRQTRALAPRPIKTTAMSGSVNERLPVISVTITKAVSGACTTPEKYAAMDRITMAPAGATGHHAYRCAPNPAPTAREGAKTPHGMPLK